MDKTKRETVVRRLKKLLAHGMKHEDTPEGQAHLEKARVMMEEHNIRFIDFEDDGTLNDDNVDVVRVDWIRYTSDFEQHLVKCIAEVLDCSYIRHGFRTKDAHHIIIGTKTDMELATWLFKWTRLQCYQLSDKTGYKGKDLRNYLYGLYFVLKDRIELVFGTEEEIVESDCRDLIVVKKDAVERKTKELYPRLGKARNTRGFTGSKSAMDHGRQDASKVSLHKHVAGSQNRQIGG